MASVETVGDRERASRLLLHPLRVKVLEVARTEGSAADFARRLDVARQKVNYHVRELERAGFLRSVGEGHKRNLVERRWVATARAYVLLPRVLGPVGADVVEAGEAFSAGRLLALTARAQDELGRALNAQRAGGERLPTLSLEADVMLADDADRAAFAEALREAVTDVVARFGAGEEGAVAGQYRLMLGVYPAPPPHTVEEGAGKAGSAEGASKP